MIYPVRFELTIPDLGAVVDLTLVFSYFSCEPLAFLDSDNLEPNTQLSWKMLVRDFLI